eukprot:GILI01016458.1.p1 GENE.GILI01016458.1~~GILI01016458.1.p1  ORF type:complete len:489 (+),score=125.35 GILI01016458.1:99-1565(+)
MSFKTASIYAFQFFCSIPFLIMMVIEAIGVDLQSKRKAGDSWFQIARDLISALFKRYDVHNVPELIKKEGFLVESHEVETSDGFLLTLFRISCPDVKNPTKGAVLLQHGLFQTAMPFVMNGAEEGLAFVLAREGFDVWLGNNRGNIYSRKHVSLSHWDARFWDWSVDELALDVDASVSYIVRMTGEPRIFYLGHSQGSAQGLIAFSSNHALAAKIRLFLAVAPGGYVQSLDNPWLSRIVSFAARPVMDSLPSPSMADSGSCPEGSSTPANSNVNVSASSSSTSASSSSFSAVADKAMSESSLSSLAARSHSRPILNGEKFFKLFGTGPFFPVFEVVRKLVPVCIYRYLAYTTFHFLFNWGHKLWDLQREHLYFNETPAGTSSKTVAHWMQQSVHGCFASFDYGSAEANYQKYGSTRPPEHKLDRIGCPVALFYGGKDLLIDFQRIIRELGSKCVFTSKIDHHEHLDSLHALDCSRVLYPNIIKQMLAH